MKEICKEVCRKFNFNGERANDIFKGSDMVSRMVLEEPFHVRCMNNHVIVGTARFDKIDLSLIKRNHKVHIFTKYIPVLDVDKYTEFIAKCYEITGRKPIVHVPADSVWSITIRIWSTDADGNEGAHVILEKEKVMFKYAYRKYLDVSFSPIRHVYRATDTYAIKLNDLTGIDMVMI